MNGDYYVTYSSLMIQLGLQLLLIILLLITIIFNIHYCTDYFLDELIHCLVYEMSRHQSDNVRLLVFLDDPEHISFVITWPETSECLCNVEFLLEKNVYLKYISTTQIMDESTNCCCSRGKNINIVTWSVNVTTQFSWCNYCIIS